MLLFFLNRGSDGGLLLRLSADDFQGLLADQPGLPWLEYVFDAVCCVCTCRRLIDLSNDCRYRDTTAGQGASQVKLSEAASALTWRADEFESLGQLGAGALGHVTAVREVATGQLFALKVRFCILNDGFCIKMVTFVLKLMNFVLQMMNSAKALHKRHLIAENAVEVRHVGGRRPLKIIDPE